MLPTYLDETALRSLGLLTLRSRRALLGVTQGIHVSLKRGHGIEFSDYRNYQPGDNPRDIDWNLYARSDRMYVKTFNEEQNLAVYIIVDGSRSMRCSIGEDKWSFAASLALGIAYVALSQRDEVSLAVLGAGAAFRIKSLSSFRQIAPLFSGTSDNNPDLATTFRAFVARTRAPGILIFISDFLYPTETLEEVSYQARSKNLDTTFIQVLSDFDRHPYDYPLDDIFDGETGIRASLASGIDSSDFDTMLTSHNRAVENVVTGSMIRFVTPADLTDPVSFIGANLRDVGLIG